MKERKNYFREIYPNKTRAATLDFARKVKIVEKVVAFFRVSGIFRSSHETSDEHAI